MKTLKQALLNVLSNGVSTQQWQALEDRGMKGYQEFDNIQALSDKVSIKQVADMVKLIAQSIALTYLVEGKGRNIVILGRDLWPVYPLLKKNPYCRNKVQYFLFSRLQLGDKGTREQWLKEVPPNSIVIDTGYAGSIFKAIKEFDPTIEGWLVSSRSSEFKQINLFKATLGHQEIVEIIERAPKIIGRCVAIDQDGKARCPQDTRDNDENGQFSVREAALWNRGLMLHLGLDARWGTFSGIVPEDRVPNKLHSHYLKVRYLRSKLTDVNTSRAPFRAKLDKKWLEQFIRAYLVPLGIKDCKLDDKAQASVGYYSFVGNNGDVFDLDLCPIVGSWRLMKGGHTTILRWNEFDGLVVRTRRFESKGFAKACEMFGSLAQYTKELYYNPDSADVYDDYGPYDDTYDYSEDSGGGNLEF